MNWQEYWKGILGFLVPGAVIIGSAVTSGSDGGSTITASEWITAIVAMVITGGAVVAKGNDNYVKVTPPTTTPSPGGPTPPPTTTN